MSVNNLIQELRTQLQLMKTNEERREALQRLTEGFCTRCGLDLTHEEWRICHCDNDE